MRLLSITPKEKIAELTHKLYAAYWVQNENVADPQVLINVCFLLYFLFSFLLNIELIIF